MERYIYGVEKHREAWCVWRFKLSALDDAVTWTLNGERRGRVRWLCNKATAAAMVGARAMEPDNMIIWED